MANELFYIMASAPATFSVGGKIYNLVGGESQGPFTSSEVNQVMISSDRQRLQLINYTGSTAKAPKVQPSNKVDQVQESQPVKEGIDPLYKGTASATPDPTFDDPFKGLPNEPINMFPGTEPIQTLIEAKAAEESTVGEVLPEPEREVNLTSMSEGSSDEVQEPIKKPRRRRTKSDVE